MVQNILFLMFSVLVPTGFAQAENGAELLKIYVGINTSAQLIPMEVPYPASGPNNKYVVVTNGSLYAATMQIQFRRRVSGAVACNYPAFLPATLEIAPGTVPYLMTLVTEEFRPTAYACPQGIDTVVTYDTGSSQPLLGTPLKMDVAGGNSLVFLVPNNVEVIANSLAN